MRTKADDEDAAWRLLGQGGRVNWSLNGAGQLAASPVLVPSPGVQG